MPQPPATARLVCSCGSALQSLPVTAELRGAGPFRRPSPSVSLPSSLTIVTGVDSSTFLLGFYRYLQEPQEIQTSEQKWVAESAGTPELQQRFRFSSGLQGLSG